ncbi:MAG: isoaspartyl peptidase/L-asparaginase [Deltaproteobacteria bacterium]|nr:isoaspartyl peptidase/L-asparaginase [Deltaproteobacteria bacterium]
MIPAIIIHGGAGEVADERVSAATAGAADAVRAGLAVLTRNGSAMDAVQAAVGALEDNPEFNAGVGSVLTRDGAVEMDAAIMDGRTLRIGGVGAVENLRRPIDLARLILEDGEHVLLVGSAAWEFALERGISPVPASELVTERSRAAWEKERSQRLLGITARPSGGGTVGACAIDRHGHVASATSTGGITFKRRGRVGDTPLCGCGTYADDLRGAASATGHGESIVRVNMTRALVERLGAGMPAHEAAWATVDELGSRVEGHGGIICVDARGQVGYAHNTHRMTYGFATADSPEPVYGVRATRSSPGTR